MLENRVKETGCDYKANEPDRLSQQAWEPSIVADAKGANVRSNDAHTKLSNAKKTEAFKEHVQINDRCSLDIYEKHWELTMPKVTIPFSKSGYTLNNKGEVEIFGIIGKEKSTTDKLIMDYRGFWTMKDEQGGQVTIIDEGSVKEALDPKHPGQLTMVKKKEFSNGTVVRIEPDGRMTLTRDQDHQFKSRAGTPEYSKEEEANKLTVEFGKNGVTKVVDRSKTWPIK